MAADAGDRKIEIYILVHTKYRKLQTWAKKGKKTSYSKQQTIFHLCIAKKYLAKPHF
jgi:hypothetical protein